MQVEKRVRCNCAVVSGQEALLNDVMFDLEKTWQIDPRIEADTFLIDASGEQWQVRLMNDKRWPWIMVVPMVAGAVDIEDVHTSLEDPLVGLLAQISKALKHMGVAQSTNVATIGNIVSQLHWHVVGRTIDDPNWPNPIWGFGEREPYSETEAEEFIAAYRTAMKQV